MLRAAEDRYRTAARFAGAAAQLAGAAWDRTGLHTFDTFDPVRLAGQVTALQVAVARGADPYLDAVLTEQNLDPEAAGNLLPASFAGVAGDGRSLTSLFDQAVIHAKVQTATGLSAQVAWDTARASLRTMAVTAVQDAGRGADSVALVARPQATGYVRMLNLPSCARCTILAGRFYRWNSGFQRHPKCDCRHVPSNENISGDLRTSPRKAIESGQVRGLSAADLHAVLDGADPSQVVNAHRGMYSANVLGRTVKATTARAGGSVRLRPESIYQIAKDRDDALRLLKRFGYLT